VERELKGTDDLHKAASSSTRALSRRFGCGDPASIDGSQALCVPWLYRKKRP